VVQEWHKPGLVSDICDSHLPVLCACDTWHVLFLVWWPQVCVVGQPASVLQRLQPCTPAPCGVCRTAGTAAAALAWPGLHFSCLLVLHTTAAVQPHDAAGSGGQHAQARTGQLLCLCSRVGSLRGPVELHRVAAAAVDKSGFCLCDAELSCRHFMCVYADMPVLV
jgi:hypothetical protein